MFSKGGPYPWQTKKGNSKLDARIEEAREKHLQIVDVIGGKELQEIGGKEILDDNLPRKNSD
jgi:hypothetical protein